MQLVNRLGVFLLIVTATACAPAAPPSPAVDLAAEEAAVRAVSANWLALEGKRDVAGIAALFADDGRLLRVGQDPVTGRAAIEASFTKDYAANPQQTVSWSTDRVLVSSSGDLAVEYGNYSVTGSGMDGAGSDRGNYVTVYQKSGGAWKAVPPATPSM
jgi:uncharacterized protein (TIGR02246 family)